MIACLLMGLNSVERDVDDTREGRNFWSNVFEWGKLDGI